MHKKEFEELMRQAIRVHTDSQPPIEDFSECLPNEVLDSIYNGTLPESKQHEIIQHLSKCRHCRTDVELYFELMEQVSKSDVIDAEVEVLDKIKALLSLPLKSSSSWDKLKELCNQLINTLSKIDASRLQDKKRLSLVTTGYRYTSSPTKNKQAKDKIKESPEQQEIREKVLSLLEMLGDDKIPLPKRITLSEELLLYVNQKSKEFKDSSSSQKADKPHRKKDND